MVGPLRNFRAFFTGANSGQGTGITINNNRGIINIFMNARNFVVDSFMGRPRPNSPHASPFGIVWPIVRPYIAPFIPQQVQQWFGMPVGGAPIVAFPPGGGPLVGGGPIGGGGPVGGGGPGALPPLPENDPANDNGITGFLRNVFNNPQQLQQFLTRLTTDVAFRNQFIGLIGPVLRDDNRRLALSNALAPQIQAALRNPLVAAFLRGPALDQALRVAIPGDGFLQQGQRAAISGLIQGFVARPETATGVNINNLLGLLVPLLPAA